MNRQPRIRLSAFRDKDNLDNKPKCLFATSERVLAGYLAPDLISMSIAEVTVQTDHKPLELIHKKPLLSAPKRLPRMLLQLQKYNLKIEYKPGKELFIVLSDVK